MIIRWSGWRHKRGRPAWGRPPGDPRDDACVRPGACGRPLSPRARRAPASSGWAGGRGGAGASGPPLSRRPGAVFPPFGTFGENVHRFRENGPQRRERHLLTGSGTAPMLNSPGLEAFTGCCWCETAGTQTYSLYFKCPPTKQMRTLW